MSNAAPVKLVYFPCLAKGLAPALALELSGIPWVGEYIGDLTSAPTQANFEVQWEQIIQPAWDNLKPTFAYSSVPVLSVPSIGDISHELAILNFIARECPTMAGIARIDFAMSQQLLCEGEQLFLRMMYSVDTTLQKCGSPWQKRLNGQLISDEDLKQMWSNTEENSHNQVQGFPVRLAKLETIGEASKAGKDRFTESGNTVGELKLWASLHLMVLVKPTLLKPFPRLTCFYERIYTDPRLQHLLEAGGNFPYRPVQYFIDR